MTVNLPDISALVDWIMAAPEREWFMFGWLVGAFMMFSILSGYWIISEAAKKGAGYDFLGIASFSLRWNIGRRGRWFCSEAVFESALQARIVLLPNIQSHKVFPGLLDLVPTAEHVRRLVVPPKGRRT